MKPPQSFADPTQEEIMTAAQRQEVDINRKGVVDGIIPIIPDIRKNYRPNRINSVFSIFNGTSKNISSPSPNGKWG